MDFFEQELRKLTVQCIGIDNPVFAGRACYGDLGGDIRVKLQFVSMASTEHFGALKNTILNSVSGEIDTNIIRFADIWVKKQVSNLNFGKGVNPHIWTCDGKSEWYVYQPTDADFKQLATVVSAYLSVFTDHSFAQEKKRGRTTNQRSAEKKPIADRLATGKQKANKHNATRPAPDASRKPESEIS